MSESGLVGLASNKRCRSSNSYSGSSTKQQENTDTKCNGDRKKQYIVDGPNSLHSPLTVSESL